MSAQMASPTPKQWKAQAKKKPLRAANFHVNGPPLVASAMIIHVTPQVYEHLREMVETGLFGFTPEDAASRLLCERIRNLMELQQHVAIEVEEP